MDSLDLDRIDVPERKYKTLPCSDEVNISSNVGTGGDLVRSTAVETYSAAKLPALFFQLAPFTNLNHPPPNWLRNAPGLRPDVLLSGNRSFPAHNHRDGPIFSSFQMAGSHPKYIGEIDVVSDAENLKKLLKVPYSKAHVSMAVHRVGKTLLLENFDMTHEAMRVHGWDWFKTMYEELTQRGITKKKLPSAQLDRQLLSKFLYYTLHESKACQVEERKPQTTLSIKETESCQESPHASLLQPTDEANKIPESTSVIPAELQWKYWTPNNSQTSNFQDRETFERTIFWTFEDLQMLLGTNMPIFGGGEYPAVSLRLRDSNKPINILTGIDYWLDNLICNVPEVVMCFHVNGIVQNYEVIKTEDIPKITDTKFNPTVIKDIAQNILSFLKSNCTKEGHTYWLFKGSNEDVVKLYDLTTLCHSKGSLNSDDTSHNPFTISVATLLYKVAVNLMQQSANNSEQNNNTIKKLLRKCVGLLEKRTQLAPVMYDAALCMLSTLHIPDSADEKSHCFSSNTATNSNAAPRTRTSSIKFSDASESSDSHSHSTCTNAEVAIISSVKELSIPDKFKQPLPSDTDDQFESFIQDDNGYYAALSYIVRGLDVFNRFNSQELRLPMSTDCKDLLIVHMQMIRNTALIYYALAKNANMSQDYGKCLMFAKIALLGYEYLEHLIEFQVQQSSENEEQNEHDYDNIAGVMQGTIPPDFSLLLPRLLALCGDVQMMQCHWDEEEKAKFGKDYQNRSDDDIAISEALVNNLSVVGEKYQATTKLVSNFEEILSTCRYCYESALDKLPSENNASNFTSNTSLGSNSNVKNVMQSTSSKKIKSGNTMLDDKAALFFSINRKLGHVANEQGAFQLNKAIQFLSNTTGSESGLENEKEVWKSSFNHLQTALKCFTDVNDFTNQALVLSNLGKLMRICAQSMAQHEDSNFTIQEQQLYYNAIEYYRKALTVQQQVKVRKGVSTEQSEPSVNDNISWELSGAYFTMAQRLQDHAPINLRSQEEIERDIIDLLNKSLRSCSEIWKNTLKRSQAVHRCAKIHSCLASLYHNSFRQCAENAKKRQFRILAEGQYAKACNLFSSLPDNYLCEFLRVLLERLAIREQQLLTFSNHSAKLKLIMEGIDIFLQCQRPLFFFKTSLEKLLEDVETSNSTSVDPKIFRESNPVMFDPTDLPEWESLFKILFTILKSFLLSLLKLTAPSGNVGNASKKKAQNISAINNLQAHTHYKKIYSAAIYLETSSCDQSISLTSQLLLERGKKLLEIIRQLKSD